jgi:hypothetical protein
LGQRDVPGNKHKNQNKKGRTKDASGDNISCKRGLSACLQFPEQFLATFQKKRVENAHSAVIFTYLMSAFSHDTWDVGHATTCRSDIKQRAYSIRVHDLSLPVVDFLDCDNV